MSSFENPKIKLSSFFLSPIMTELQLVNVYVADVYSL